MNITIKRMPANFYSFATYDEDWFRYYMADYEMFRMKAMSHRKERMAFMKLGQHEKADKAAKAVKAAAVCAAEKYNEALKYKARLFTWHYCGELGGHCDWNGRCENCPYGIDH